MRHATRWGSGEADSTAYLKVLSALLMSLRGSVCIYQGEELGLPEAELAFEDLRDPYGIRFWPEFKGRDGCRTPMVWERRAAEWRLFDGRSPGCRCPRSTWRSRSTRQAADPASLLAHYRRFLAFRRAHPALGKGEIEFLAVEGDAVAFTRGPATSRSSAPSISAPKPAVLELPGERRATVALEGHGLTGEAEDGTDPPRRLWRLVRPARLKDGGIFGGNDMAELTLRHVRKAYGSVEILHGIDLDIKSGEFIVFVGPSGCGKSTLLRTIAGLEEITSGTLQIDGEMVNDVPPSKRGIAMVFQSYALYPHMTVYDNMAFGMKIAREPKAEIERRVRAGGGDPAAHQVSRPPAQGAVGRPAPARRHRPRDRAQPEGLPVRRAAVQPRRGAARRDAHRDRQAQGEHGQHDDDLRHPRPGRGDDAGRPHRGAERRLCRAGRLADGALQASRQPVRRPVHRLAGDEHRAGDHRAGGQPTVVAHLGGRKANVPIATPARARARVSFGVRPEDLTIATGTDFLFEGPVDYVEQLGEVQLVYLDIGRADQPLVAKLPGNAGRAGATLRLTADPGDLHIFDADGHSFARNLPAARAA